MDMSWLDGFHSPRAPPEPVEQALPREPENARSSALVALTSSQDQPDVLLLYIVEGRQRFLRRERQ